MTDLELIELRIRILTAFLEKKTEQYHQVTLRGDMQKRHKIHRQCYDLRRIIDRLNDKRKKLGGVTDGKAD